MAHIGQAGHVAGYDVFLAGDTLHVIHAASGHEWRHVVPNFGTALADLARQPGLRLGWARFPDDAEAVYVYDAEDGNFGYALNLSDPALSEWGYAPFVGEEERACDHCGGPLDEDAETDDAMQTVCGACVGHGRAGGGSGLPRRSRRVTPTTPGSVRSSPRSDHPHVGRGPSGRASRPPSPAGRLTGPAGPAAHAPRTVARAVRS